MSDSIHTAPYMVVVVVMRRQNSAVLCAYYARYVLAPLFVYAARVFV